MSPNSSISRSSQPDNQALWRQVLDNLKHSTSKSQFKQHFLNAQAVLEENGDLTILLPYTANIDFVVGRLDTVVHRAIRDIDIYKGRPIHYQIAPSKLPEPTPYEEPADYEATFSLLMFQERAEKDIISFKRIFVQMTDDTLAGILLSAIVFWHTPNEKGESKLRVFKEGHHWIAKTKLAWEEETTLKLRQFDRALNILLKLNLIVKKNFMFNNMKTLHLRLNKIEYVRQYHKALRRTGSTDS